MYQSAPSPPSAWHASLERASSGEPLPISPTAPRAGRLRGLSLLRNYTQTHILSRDSSHSHSSSSNTAASNNQQRPSVARAASHPSPTLITRAASTTAAVQPPPPQSPPPTAHPSTTGVAAHVTETDSHDTEGTSSGGLSTVGGGTSRASRTVSEPPSTASAASPAILSSNDPDLTASMARTRSATVTGAPDSAMAETASSTGTDAPPNAKPGQAHQLPSIKFSAHNDLRANRPSLVFTPMSRILPTGREVIKVGRYSERDNPPQQAVNVPSSAPVGFKSKVVSRRHCEFYHSAGKWFIRDVKSSSGTFLNHVRLSSPGTESKPFPVNDGDIVQLGIDFKGGEEMIFRCVKIRVELNKGWHTGPSSFNVASHKRLRELNSAGTAGSSQDCSICLGPVAPCQSLFVAPCSHTWHFKCIRVIINGPHYPHFICPNCRTVADLEAELDDLAAEDWEAEASEADILPETQRIATDAASQPVETPSRARNISSEATAATTESGLPESDIIPTPLANGSLNGPQVGTILEEEHSNSDTTDSDTHVAPNTSVAPVDILIRRASTAPARSTHEEGQTRNQSNRTPSPRLAGDDGRLLPGEGPMTPRNDAGPFVFDGSAGQGVNLATMAASNLNDQTVHEAQMPAS